MISTKSPVIFDRASSVIISCTYGIIAMLSGENSEVYWRGRLAGLGRTLGKRVYRKVPRVRIPPSPPSI